MLYKGLDIYEGLISDFQDGIFCISLVSEPAVERDFVCFSKDKKMQKFAVENQEKRLISGVILAPDTPIYRIDGDYEYFITYSKETVRQLAEKMLVDNTFRNISLQHNGKLIGGVNLVELYLKDTSKGIVPNFIEDIPDGTLLATFHITDEALWEHIKNGEDLNGFSLEGLFSIIQLSKNENKDKKDNKMSKISRFVKNLMKFSQVETSKGTLYFAEDEIAVGVEVFVDGENEEKVIAEDGEYVLEDGRTVVVADGKVSEIREKEVEEEKPVEEPVEVEVEAEEETPETEVEVVEPQPEERDVNEERIAALEEKVAELVSKVAELEAVVAQIATKPIVEPIVEEFEKAKEKPDYSGLTKGQKKAIERISNAFKK